MRIIALIGLLILLVVVWSLFEVRSSQIPALGAAPNVAMETSNGTINLTDLKGKVVLVDFWATWCGPCRQSMPAIDAVYRKYHAKGLEVMGVTHEQKDKVDLIAFARQAGVSYPLGFTPIETGQAYKVGGIPHMVLIDKQGQVRWQQIGFGPGVESEMQEKISTLLSE